MGRGLSDLQKGILRLASRNYCRGGFCLYFGHLFRRKIFQELHGWDWDITFDPEAIGLKKYNVTMASTSRAIKRLQERGLVVRARFKSAIDLTEKGIEAAKNL